jgi:hypothetical protein
MRREPLRIQFDLALPRTGKWSESDHVPQNASELTASPPLGVEMAYHGL